MHPLLGGLNATNVMMEVSANQGYTGHQIHVCNFAQQWRTYLDWDTMAGHPETNGTSGTDSGTPSLTIAHLLTARERGGASKWGGGLACVSNIGNVNNLTGHVLAAANTYACGRLAWDPTLAAETVDREWATMTFPEHHHDSDHGGGSNGAVVDTVVDILGRSWLVYEGYTSPMGIGFMIDQHNPFGCAPKTNRSSGEGGWGPDGAKCPPAPPPPPGVSYYW
jgi:alpha-glucuronidase